MLVRQHYLSQATPEEMHEIDVSLTNMRSKWNILDKQFRSKFVNVEQNVGIWQQLHDDMSSLSLFLAKVEQLIRDNKNDDLEKVEETTHLMFDETRILVARYNLESII